MDNLESGNQEKIEILNAQLKIERELDRRKKVRPIEYNPLKLQFTVPRHSVHAEKNLQ